jgi:anti-sigma factor RsiW
MRGSYRGAWIEANQRELRTASSALGDARVPMRCENAISRAGRKPMGLRQWISKMRKQEDAAAIERAKERASDDSVAEKEIYTGDIVGRQSDAEAARRFGRTDTFGK